MIAQMLEVSLLRVGTVLRLERNVWSMVNGQGKLLMSTPPLLPRRKIGSAGFVPWVAYRILRRRERVELGGLGLRRCRRTDRNHVQVNPVKSNQGCMNKNNEMSTPHFVFLGSDAGGGVLQPSKSVMKSLEKLESMCVTVFQVVHESHPTGLFSIRTLLGAFHGFLLLTFAPYFRLLWYYCSHEPCTFPLNP